MLPQTFLTQKLRVKRDFMDPDKFPFKFLTFFFIFMSIAGSIVGGHVKNGNRDKKKENG